MHAADFDDKGQATRRVIQTHTERAREREQGGAPTVGPAAESQYNVPSGGRAFPPVWAFFGDTYRTRGFLDKLVPTVVHANSHLSEGGGAFPFRLPSTLSAA